MCLDKIETDCHNYGNVRDDITDQNNGRRSPTNDMNEVFLYTHFDTYQTSINSIHVSNFICYIINNNKEASSSEKRKKKRKEETMESCW